MIVGSWILVVSSASAIPIPLLAVSNKGNALGKTTLQMDGSSASLWISNGGTEHLAFKPASPAPLRPDGSLYLSVSYLDQGYGKLGVKLITPGRKAILPDRFLALSRTNSGNIVTARMRFTGVPSGTDKSWFFKIAVERSNGEALAVDSVTLHDTPFDDPEFKLVISDPWLSRYQGTTIKPKDNTTLKGKVMAGYQGWFRTPNDLEGRGWAHWGNMQEKSLSIDMWPDTSHYPPAIQRRIDAGEKFPAFKEAPPITQPYHMASRSLLP